MSKSREAVTSAVAGTLFLRLSQEQKKKLFENVGEKVDWDSVKLFTRQALRSVDAARTLSAHYVQQLTVLSSALESQMYLGGSQMCIADLACYVALNAPLASFDDQHKWALCNVSRWYDLLQHEAAALEPPAELRCGLVSFDYDTPDVLPTVSSLTPLVTPTGATAAVPAASAAPAPAPAPAPAADEKPKEKKEKKETPPAAAPPAAADGQSDVSKLDIRVGLILSAEKHPEADKLYVEKVDVGEAAPRTVVSGLVDFMPPEALTNRRAVLLCNLKPAKMKGIESQAMVLAASNEEHTLVELLTPPDGCAVGERVRFEGHPGEPLAPNVIAKKKVWEAVAPQLCTDEGKVATYAGLPFMTEHGPCTVATLVKGKIK